MAEAYITFCEKLWRGWWLDHRLRVPPFTASDFVCKVLKPFKHNDAPEPYISFGVGAEPLVVLLTNPGKAMSGRPLGKNHKYAKAARKLGFFYQRELAGRPAGDRIAKLQMLSCCLGYEGVLQVEACPFHSRSLPINRKNALLREAKTDRDGLLGHYAGHLRAFLRRKPVLSLQAAPTRASLRPETPKSYPWLKWIANTAGLDLHKTSFVPLVKKGSKTTAAAWVSKGRVRKALVLMMGMNGLPAADGLCKLATALRKFRRLR